jgi:hypothetical protein
MLYKKIIIHLLLSGVLCFSRLSAQTHSFTEFEYIRQSDARLTGDNPAGLQHLPISKIALAEIYFSENKGEFVNYYQSADSYEAGAVTESFFRLNPKVVLYGKVRYANFNGKQMGGSAFVNPYEHTFDIQETADSTRGDKNLEDYRLTGAASIQLSERLTLGGRIDYRAANYAKFKDLRHVNKLFDLSAAVGVSHYSADWLEWGANYFYRRNVEEIGFKMYGTSEQRYISLVDFGSFYGRAEEFGSAGYTDPDYNNPDVGEWHGASLQIALKKKGKYLFFNEFSYRIRNGYFGKRSPSTPVFLEHRAPVWAYNGSFSFGKGRNQQRITAGIERESLKNSENIYRFEHIAGGRNDVVYLGDNRVLSRTIMKASLAYTANLNVEDYCPQWMLKAEANYYSREQTVSLYPYFRRQDIHFANLNVSAGRNITRRQNRYGLFAGVQYDFGDGVPKEDGTYATPSETQNPPPNNDIFLFREYEYLTATRITGNLGCILTRTFAENLKGYIRLDYAMTKAFGVEYLSGSNFHQATFTAGCEF